jgi:hypothetical protein
MPTIKATISLEDVGNGVVYSKVHSIAADETGWQYYELATGTTDQAIPFTLSTGVTTVDIVLIESSQAISWRLNAADTAITIDANRVHLLFGTNITALLMSNASGSTAYVKIYIAGT